MAFDKRVVRSALMSFRDRLSDFSSRRNEKVVEYLLSMPPSPDGSYDFPEVDEIAKSTALSPAKVSEIVRDLYKTLVKNLSAKNQVIKKLTCFIWIRIPADELEKRGRKNPEHAEHLKGMSTMFACELPFIPRIGEEISLEFVDGNQSFRHGYVHNVTHQLYGDEQVIEIHVHPFDRPYTRWMKMKEEYEAEERDRKWLESEIRRRNPANKSGSGSPTRKPGRPHV